MDDISHSELSKGSEERSMILNPINTDVRENCSAACLAPPDSYRSSCYCSIRQRYEKYLQEKPHHSHLVSHFKINQICHMDHNFLNLLIKHRIEDVPGDGVGRGEQSPRCLKNLGWMQAASKHQSWQGRCKEEGLCPYFHPLKMFTWQLCLQAIHESLNRQWLKSEVHSHQEIKPQDPEDSFCSLQSKHKFHLPWFTQKNYMNDGTLCSSCVLLFLARYFRSRFSCSFSLTISIPHVSAATTPGHHFLPSCICVII